MLYEKYNSRYLLTKALNSETQNDKSGFIRYLNLINTCLFKDELNLQNKLLRESAVYEYLKEASLLINVAIKLTKYSNRKLPPSFTLTQNIISEIKSPLIKIYTRIAKMFSEKGNYYCALQWINKVYTYYQENPPEGSVNQKYLTAIELRGYILSKRLSYLTMKKKKGKLTYVNKITPLSKTDYYYINKKWYEEYKLFILTNNGTEYNIQIDEKVMFPREIDNYEFLSGKEIFGSNNDNSNTQYILGDDDKVIKIKEDEWMFLKSKFGCTNELKVRNQKDKEIIYKVLVCCQKEREGNNFYFFKQKYLIFNNEDDLYSYFQKKYNEENNIKIYQFNKELSKKERKELLFDIMYFFSIKKSEKHFIHEDYLSLFKNDKSFIYNEKYKYNYGGFIIIDINEFISIRNKGKCFQCQLNDNCIKCNECSRNSTLLSKFEFCSEECLSQHNKQYHKQIYLYQTFEYNTIQMLKNINSNNKYDNGGLIGFMNTNIINNSYSQINSILQCLLHCMGFVEYFRSKLFINEPLNKSYLNNNKEFPLSNAFSKLIEQIWNQNDNTLLQIKPQLSNETIINALTLSDKKYEKYISNNEQYKLSSFEFIQDIFNYLSNELNRSKGTPYDERISSSYIPDPLIQYNHLLNKNNSIIQNLFYIQFRYKNKCKIQTCEHISNIYKSSYFLDVSIPSKKTFQYYIKFKYFICGTIKPEIREYEIDESIITVGDFKKKYFTQVMVFDIIGLNKETKQEFPLILNDYEQLFIYNNDKLELTYPEYELVLYESTNDHWNYALYFIYPFIYKFPKNQNTSILDGILSSIGCFSNCTNDNNDLIKIGKKHKNIMFYPMRLKIEKSELSELGDCLQLRQSIFTKMGLTIPEIPLCLKEKTLLFKEQGIVSSFNDDQYIEPVRNLSIIKEDKKYFLFLGEESNINLEHCFSRYLTMEKEGNIVEKEIGTSLNDLIHNMLNVQKGVYTCDKCKNYTLTNVTISKLPIYLNVHMKRIDFENKRKNGKLVEYQDVINMFEFVDKEKLFSFENDVCEKECVYELYAVNEYRGQKWEEGYYVSYTNVRGEWFCFDEGNMYKDNKYKNGNSVILFYKRRKMFI